jgi:transmembrane sensor
MDTQRIQILVEKFIDNSATPKEEAELMAWYRSANEQEVEWLSEFTNEREVTRLSMLAEINSRIEFTPVRRMNYKWIAAAASILIFLSIGGYFYLKPKPQQQVAKIQQDLKPGMNGAILTLANGQKVILEKTKVGAITKGVNKSNDSLLVYNDAEAIGYNTLETPKGRQYAVVLPDGTKVWLNAASSLKYPTKFTGNQRLVELTGEAYFEVVHNAKQPFKVKTNNQITEDIATSFNVNSYADESATVTTLVEGAIRVNNKLVKPGYSAISPLSTTTEIKQADIEQIIAWKNGVFNFQHADIKTVMKQFARWYDVDVEFEGQLPDAVITGEVSRNVNASQALKILSYLSINYRIEGKKIIITK